VLFADADASTAAQSLTALADALDHVDVAIGSRRLPDSLILRPQPLSRRAASRLFASAVRLLFDLPYRDTQCGAKAFRREAVARLASRVRESRWAFDVDILLSARSLGLSVAECPVIWSDQPGSRLQLARVGQEVAPALWRLKTRYMPAPAATIALATPVPSVAISVGRSPAHVEWGPAEDHGARQNARP
jgi:hypothetical protein